MGRKGKRRQTGSVRRLPSGKIQARIMDPVSQDIVSLGTYDTMAEADSAIALARVDQLRGAWVDPRSGRVKFETYAKDWLEGRDLRPRTRELYEGLLRLHILPSFGHLQINKVTTVMVRGWHSALGKADGPGDNTRAKAYRLLRTIFNTAIEDEIIVRNPCTLKGAAAERSPERPSTTIGEVYSLVEAMPPQLEAIVAVAAFASLRLGEVLALRRRHIDLLHRRIRVEGQIQELKDGTRRSARPKTDAGDRTVSIPKALVPYLERHLSDFTANGADSLLFDNGDGGAIRRVRLYRAWKKARKAVGRPDLTFHDLRHFGNMIVADTGATTKDLMSRMGHSSPAAALRYQHASQARDDAIAEAMDEVIQAAKEREHRAPVIDLHPAQSA